MAGNNGDPAPLIPVSIITGFLGSGKTTLLSRLLADPRMARAAVIINEFGEVGLDHMLVTTPREDVVLLSSGCLCCSLRGDLVNTLASLFGERARGEIPEFDRVLVETTGLADPAPVLLTVTADPELSRLFRVERVITTVDAVYGWTQLEDNLESLKQACVADVLLITKTDIAGPAEVERLQAQLRTLNPTAEVREVAHGAINPDDLFVLSATSKAAPESEARRLLGSLDEDLADRAPEHHDHEHGHHHDHDHDHDAHGGIRSFAISLDTPATPAGLQMWMGMLGDFRGPNLLRIKGLVNIQDRPIVIQAVQHMFYPLTELAEWPDADRRSRIVFIVRDIAQEEIERTLDALSFDVTPAGPGKLIDADAFRRFAETAKKFHA